MMSDEEKEKLTLSSYKEVVDLVEKGLEKATRQIIAEIKGWAMPRVECSVSHEKRDEKMFRWYVSVWAIGALCIASVAISCVALGVNIGQLAMKAL